MNLLTITDKLNKTNLLRYLAYMLLLLPVFGFRDFLPPNELKYVSIIEESIRNNTWFTFYNHGNIYADKPPLFFWLLKIVRLLTGGYDLWIIGAICLAPAMGTLAVMDRWTRRFAVGIRPVTSNLMLLTTVMFTGAALIIRMDMMMTFFITLSLYTFFKIFSGVHKKRDIWLMPFFIFMAVFSKGPVGFLVPLITITAFLISKRAIGSFFRYFGWRQWLVMLGLCGLWFFAIYMEGGSEYLHNLTVKQTVGRGIDSFHHKEPFWYYLLNIPYTFAPWTLLIATVFIMGIRKKLTDDNDTLRFFAVMAGSTLLTMSLVSAKINIYLLPVYPFIVYLCAAMMAKLNDNMWLKAGAVLPALVMTLALPGFIIAKPLVPDFEISGAIPYISMGIMTAGGVLSLLNIFKRGTEKGIVITGASMLIAVFVLSFGVPHYNKYIGFNEMASTAHQKAKEEGIEKYVHHRFYTGENMDVFLGQPLEFTTTVRALDSLDMLPERRILFIRSRHPLKDPELREFLSRQEQGWSTSQYAWYIIGGNQ